MQRPLRSFFRLFLLGTSITALTISACSGGERPPVAPDENNKEGGSGPSLNEAGTPYEAGDAAEAGPVPETCVNTIKDGAETDVDCGGNQCGKCIDGKKCIAKTDCAGGACLDGKCATPACTNKEPDGDETDVDCGGSICARCTIGKRCKTGSDCLSGTCSANSSCSCPPGMAIVPRKGGGGAYCIDQVEVTKYQYEQFTLANVDIEDQEPFCKGVNTSFNPRDAWVAQVAPPNFQQVGVGKAFNYSLPVHYVDWCDAYEYCRWAKKQLCGSITGGPAAFDKPTDATENAWYNACSAGGDYPYSYAGSFTAGKCNGGAPAGAGDTPACGPGNQQRSGYGCAENHDDGIHELVNGSLTGTYSEFEFAECTGGFSNIYQMIGNVAEWENSCDGDQADANCRVRGGSYTAGNGNADALSCGGERTVQRVPQEGSATAAAALADVGFRCCLY